MHATHHEARSGHVSAGHLAAPGGAGVGGAGDGEAGGTVPVPLPGQSSPEGDRAAAEPKGDSLVRNCIPLTCFGVGDVHAEHERLNGLGVRFVQEPVHVGPVTTAILDDTCGDLIQFAQFA
jgi:hypothetical protein